MQCNIAPKIRLGITDLKVSKKCLPPPTIFQFHFFTIKILNLISGQTMFVGNNTFLQIVSVYNCIET